VDCGLTAVELLPFAASIIPDRRLAKNRSAGRRLASERTFLAWIRTSLALLAGGIAVEASTSDLFIAPVRKTVAVLLLLLAMAMALGAGAFFRWLGVERAMRRKAPPPLPLLAPVPAIGGAVVAAVLVVFVVFRVS
jgi:putative membrane protein